MVFGIQQQINMANWTVTTVTQQVAAGASVAASQGTHVLTITPIAGYVISASQFKIGGATGPVSVSGAYRWTGGNVDIGVNYVDFKDTGTPGTPSNTVTATVQFTTFTMPSSAKIFYIDIDEISDVDHELRPVCIRTHHDLNQDSAAVDQHTVTTTSPTGITQTDNASTASVLSTLLNTGEVQVRYYHQGTVP